MYPHRPDWERKGEKWQEGRDHGRQKSTKAEPEMGIHYGPSNDGHRFGEREQQMTVY